MDVICTLVCVVSCAALTGGAAPALSIHITPAHAHVNLVTPDTGDHVHVTCEAETPITRCQFRVGDHAPIDPGLRTNSEQTVRLLYEGDKGRCQVTLPWTIFEPDGTYEVVGCRMRDRSSDWSYATMTVYGSKRRALAVNVSRPEVTAAPGEALSVLANTSSPLGECSARLHDRQWLPLDDVTPCDTRVCYHGAGLEGGQCGVTFNNVSDEDNGRLWIRVNDKDFNEGVELVRVIVTKRPEYVNLDYNVTADKGGTMTLKAWCSVIGGRPTPTVTWYLSGVEIEEGVVGIPGDEWAWPEDEKTINQSLTRTLTEGDGGKELRCTASFMANGKTLSAVKLVEYEGGRQSTSPAVVVGEADIPEHLSHSEHGDEDDGGYGLVACILFGLVIFLYATVVCLTDFTMFAWRRQLCCFKRLSYESAASLDNDVMDYHATVPPRGAMREARGMESYMEPIAQQTQERRPVARESYFLPTTTESNRVSPKAERTLGLEHMGRAPQPTPRYAHAPSKNQKANTSTLKKKSSQKSLFMTTPVELLVVEQQGGLY